MRGPNLTVIFISVAAVVVFGLGGGIVLTALGFDPVPFYGFFTATLATVIGFAGIIRSQNKLDEKVDIVQHNLNGRLSQLITLALDKSTTPEQEEHVLRIADETGVYERNPDAKP